MGKYVHVLGNRLKIIFVDNFHFYTILDLVSAILLCVEGGGVSQFLNY
jgi:hypothetical protein